jgi:hypothetical protein
MVEKSFAAGATIFSEGDASEHAYILRSGRVEVVKSSPGGPVRLAVLVSGDVIGEMGLLDERPRSATVRALEPVVADAVDAPEFNRLLIHDPDKAMELLRALFERLRSANHLLTAPSAGPVRHLASIPRVRLVPQTPETAATLPAGGVEVTRFPFRVGRRPETREAHALCTNDVYLPDARLQILSPHHFAIDLAPEGVVVRDRGSRRGTVVNGTRIGALAPRDLAPLHVGDNEVVAGHPLFREQHSPFRFKVVVA